MNRRFNLCSLILSLFIIIYGVSLYAHVPPPPYYPPLCQIGGCERVTEPQNLYIHYTLQD